jgi:hypothetical protein
MVVLLTREMLGGLRTPRGDRMGLQRWHYNPGTSNRRNLLNFMMSLRSGICNGVRVRVGRLSEMINTSCIESLDFLVSSTDPSECEDWQTILKGDGLHHANKLLLAENFKASACNINTVGSGSSSRRGNVLRRSSGDFGGGGGGNSGTQSSAASVASTPNSLSGRRTSSPSRSPFSTADSSFWNESFKLRDHMVESVGGNAGDALLNVRSSRTAETGMSIGRSRSPLRGQSSNFIMSETINNEATSEMIAPLATRNSFTFEMILDSHKVEMNAVGSAFSSSAGSFTSSVGSAATPGIVTLTLKDPSFVESAINLLRSSTNLYDQMDILHCM